MLLIYILFLADFPRPYNQGGVRKSVFYAAEVVLSVHGAITAQGGVIVGNNGFIFWECPKCNLVATCQESRPDRGDGWYACFQCQKKSPSEDFKERDRPEPRFLSGEAHIGMTITRTEDAHPNHEYIAPSQIHLHGWLSEIDGIAFGLEDRQNSHVATCLKRLTQRIFEHCWKKKEQ